MRLIQRLAQLNVTVEQVLIDETDIFPNIPSSWRYLSQLASSLLTSSGGSDLRTAYSVVGRVKQAEGCIPNPSRTRSAGKLAVPVFLH